MKCFRQFFPSPYNPPIRKLLLSPFYKSKKDKTQIGRAVCLKDKATNGRQKHREVSLDAERLPRAPSPWCLPGRPCSGRGIITLCQRSALGL